MAKSMSGFQSPTPRFIQHWLFRGGHAQTLAGAYLWRTTTITAEEHHVDVTGGDKIVLHVSPPCAPSHHIALLIHGVAGCHASGYMQRIALKLSMRGIGAVRMDMRGYGAGARLARQSAHAGRTEDLVAAVEFLAKRFPDARLTLVGFSLGAGIILKMLGDPGSMSVGNLEGAIAVAPPLDLAVCSRNIGKGINRLYDRSIVGSLLKYVRRRSDIMDGQRFDLRSRPRTLYEFDHHVTARLGGFASVDDYYQRCSSLPTLPNLRVPTLILAARDDPLIPFNMFLNAEYSATTKLFATDHGGHLGFVQRADNSDADWHWMDWRIVDWVGQFS